MLGSVHDTVGLSELSFGFDLVRSSLGWVMVLAWFKFRGAARIHSGQFRVSVKGSQQVIGSGQTQSNLVKGWSTQDPVNLDPVKFYNTKVRLD